MKFIYRILFSTVNTLFPKIFEKDLEKLSKTQTAVVGIKYWLSIKLLD